MERDDDSTPQSQMSDGQGTEHDSDERRRLLVEHHPEGIVTSIDNRIAYANPAALQLLGAASFDSLAGRSLFDFVLPEAHAAVHACALAVAQHKPVHSRKLRLIRLDGGVRVVLVDAVPVTFSGSPAIESVLRDVTKGVETADQLEEKNARVHLLQKVAVASNEASSSDEALSIATAQICHFTGWPLGHVYKPDGAESPRLVSTEIWYAEHPERYRTLYDVSRATAFAPGEGLPGRVWATGSPSWIVDVMQDGNFPRARLSDQLGIRSAFGFPVLVGKRPVAVLEFFSETMAEPNTLLLETMQHVGMQLGRVIEREEAAAALQASEERYRKLTESAVDAIIVSDDTDIIRDWNKQAELMFGYKKDEAVGQHTAIIMPERYREPHRKGMERLHRTGEAHVLGRTIELEGLRKSGEEFPLELSLSQSYASGKPIYTGIIRDITERRQAAEAMRSREAILEAAAYAAEAFLRSPSWWTHAPAVLERVGRAANVSRAYIFEHHVGEAGQLHTSQRFEWVVPGVTPQIENPALQNLSYEDAGFSRWLDVLGRGDTIHSHVRHLPQSEQEHLRQQGIESIAVVPIFAGGEWWGLMGYDDCGGERTWSNAELDALSVVAGMLGAAILRARDEAALRASEKALTHAVSQLEKRNQELQDFAHVASHDLQEPLRKVNAFAQLLSAELADEVSDEAKVYLDRIQDAARRMSILIKDLLQFSRVSTREQPIVEVDLNAIITGVLSDLEIRIEEVEGRVEVAPLCRLKADPTQMRQLFQNLISNALKFHRRRVPPVLTITSSVLEPEDSSSGQRMCRIEVTDNGLGFDEKYAESIFHPFHRLHTKEEYPGSGIGLAICRRVVERHGGHITATSTPGKGSRFTITLPEAG